MPTVVAVLLIAACDPGLLHCAPIQTWHRTWETTQACRAAEPDIRVRVAQNVGPDRTVLATCRLFLDEEGQYAPPPRAVTEINQATRR